MASKKRGEYYYTLILLESPRTKDHAELRWCRGDDGGGLHKGTRKERGVAAIEGKKKTRGGDREKR